MPLRLIGLKARYLYGSGKNTRMFHVINLSEVRAWETHHSPEDEGWTVLTVYTACGQRETMTSAAHFRERMRLAVDPPRGLKPCPRCFTRWEKLGKPLTAEQWAERIKALRTMTSHAARAKANTKKEKQNVE